MLNANNKITYVITGQQAPDSILHTHLYMHYLEYVTKGHIAMHIINLKGFILLFFSDMTVLNKIAINPKPIIYNPSQLFF